MEVSEGHCSTGAWERLADPGWGWGGLGVSHLSLVLSLRWGLQSSVLGVLVKLLKYKESTERTPAGHLSQARVRLGPFPPPFSHTHSPHGLLVQLKCTLFFSKDMGVTGHPAQL